jgi:hypothetical protein
VIQARSIARRVFPALSYGAHWQAVRAELETGQSQAETPRNGSDRARTEHGKRTGLALEPPLVCVHTFGLERVDSRNIFTGDFAVILLATYGYSQSSLSLCLIALFVFVISAGIDKSKTKMQSELIQSLRNRIELQERTEETLRNRVEALLSLQSQARELISASGPLDSPVEEARQAARNALDRAAEALTVQSGGARRTIGKLARRMTL